jgi:uncharacterized protein YjbI with pentapeptide repeats
VVEVVGSRACPADLVPAASDTVNFRSAVFHDRVRFRGRQLDVDLIDFGNAVFSGGTVDFRNAVFSDGTLVDFSGAVFSGATVNFSRAVFSDARVDFSGRELSGRCSAAVFSGGRVDFSGVVFSDGTVNFNSVVFSGGIVDFAGASGSAPAGLVSLGTSSPALPNGLLLPSAWRQEGT